MEQASIAICISGQVRAPVSVLERIAAEAARCKADVFISVWSDVGQKTFEGAVGPKNIRRITEPEVARQIPENWLGRMKAVFPDFARFFPALPPMDPARLVEIFPQAEIEVEADSPAFDFAAGDSNSLRMLHRIWRANRMKRAAEQARGQRYEKVLRLRPDMLFDGAGLANLKLDENVLFVQGHAGNRKDYLNDTIWATRSENDDAICALYQRCKSVDPAAWRGIHQELAATAQAAGLKPLVLRIIRPASGGADQGHDAHTKAIGQNLLHAISEGKVEPAQAGGAAFCSLVATVVRQKTLPENTLVLLENVQRENRNAYQHALIYLSNICIQNQALPVNDRIALLTRVMLYYGFQKAEGHLEVRITELPEVFDGEALALQGFVLHGFQASALPQQALPMALAKQLDELWAARIKADRAEIGVQVRHRLLTNAKFMITLHRALSKTTQHQAAFDLAQGWANHAPDNWKAYDLLAGSARALGDDAGALAVYAQAERHGVAHSRLSELKGNQLMRAGQAQAAIDAYEQALALPAGNRGRIQQGLDAARAKI